jgi:hypothetical protein
MPFFIITKSAPTVDRCDVGQVTIDVLPDDVLLCVFDWYLYLSPAVEAWHTLVHVCRQWRGVIFGSPRRLDLQIYCTAKKPVREMLDFWPDFPIVIWAYDPPTWGVDNIVAALEQKDRIRRIDIHVVEISQWEGIFAAMQEPFPALTHLRLESRNESAPVLTNSFLGGSAPRLQTLWLSHVPFPGLPKMILSITELVELSLYSVPHSGYISPEAVVTTLSALTRLERFQLSFLSPRSRPARESRRLPPRTRSALPALTIFGFRGVCEYLEDLVARLDAPRLEAFDIRFFHQLIFDTPHLSQFTSRTAKLKTPDEARVVLTNRAVSLTLSSSPQTSAKVPVTTSPPRTPIPGGGELTLQISCPESAWQLQSLAQVCTSSLPLLRTVEHLYIRKGAFEALHWKDTEDTQWLELFQSFTAVKNLYLSKEFVPRIAPVLQELTGERVTEVLPALQSFFLAEHQQSGPVHEAIGQFVAARELIGHAIAVSSWEIEQKMWMEVDY